jgi:hypothetical protein
LSEGFFVEDVYLEVAVRRKMPLASRDEALRSAGKRCGLKLL